MIDEEPELFRKWREAIEARAYRKGVEDAAKVVEVTANKFSSERTIRTILALLEKDKASV